MSLATKYRPKTLEEVVGQNITKTILLKQVSTGNIKNVYLFTGKTGTGKTTISRALANAINGGNGDAIEIDAASNSGVDSVRDLIKSAGERSLTGKYKVIIIDEVHVFSNTAWQAFLKYLEEPSPYTVFILCTTEVQKVPATILNRVQQFNLTQLSDVEIENRLDFICKAEHLNYTEEALKYIAGISEGSMRDAICKLERCVSYSNYVELNSVIKCLGQYSYNTFFDLVNSIIDGDEAKLIEIVETCNNEGLDLRIFVDKFLSFCLDLSKFTIFKSYDVLKIPKSLQEDVSRATNLEGAKAYYAKLVDKILSLKIAIKQDANAKDTCEIILLQAARCQW